MPTALSTRTLPGGGELRLRGPGRAPSLLLVGGSGFGDGPGRWSPTTEWLARGLARAHRGLTLAELRYAHASWERAEEAARDGWEALAALRGLGAAPRMVVGFSLGGMVAVALGAAPEVRTVTGLAAWLPVTADLGGLDGTRLHLAHGTLDASLPRLPGVVPTVSAHAVEHAAALGVDAHLTVIRGGMHGVAARLPGGRLLPLPRARRWLAVVLAEAERAFRG